MTTTTHQHIADPAHWDGCVLCGSTTIELAVGDLRCIIACRDELCGRVYTIPAALVDVDRVCRCGAVVADALDLRPAWDGTDVVECDACCEMSASWGAP